LPPLQCPLGEETGETFTAAILQICRTLGHQSLSTQQIMQGHKANGVPFQKEILDQQIAKKLV
jgi:hypothetical protein